ncbi:MAG: anthranilate phosphoribosyltransferase [Porticoccaceae bacterium]
MTIVEALNRMAAGGHLNQAEMYAVMSEVMSGSASDAQIGALLMALRIKGETIDEICGAVEVMRELVNGVAVDGDYLVDIVGTGGDGANLFNLSTASSLVVAAAGGRVAKHGNRSVSSKSGAADLLEAAGVAIDLSSADVAACVDELGIGFMFAPAHHSAMKYAIGPRKELGMRTIFNILGPMTNPAGVKRQLVGCFSAALCRPMAEVLGRLGAEHVAVVHSEDGLDEISLAAPTAVAEWRNGAISEYTLTPEDLNIKRQTLEGLIVNSADESLALIRDALGKRRTEAGQKAAEIIALNSGMALYVAGVASSAQQGVALASDTIATGLALNKLTDLVAFTQCQAARPD